MESSSQSVGSGDKEVERLKKQLLRAQEKSDIKEESALCNAIGDRYFQLGDYGKALRYHQMELALSSSSGNLLDEGVAHRKVGECLCELGQFDEAAEHQKSHLQLSRRLRNLAEEQRALATLGRTFYIHSQSEQEQSKRDEVGSNGRSSGSRVSELLLLAGTHYLQSLEVCDKLVGLLSDQELLEMRSRLYLNLGLVYELKEDYHSARMFMVKALGVLEEMKDSATIYQCHSSLGSLHLLECHAHLALPSFQSALKVASELCNRQYELASLKDISQFEESKSCLKRCLKLAESLNTDKQEVVHMEQQLKAVRKIIYFSGEVEKTPDDAPREKAGQYDRLGDLCCALKAYPAAAKFYGKQLGVVEGAREVWQNEEVGQVYVSLASTLEDCHQFSQALYYYNKEVALLKDKPAEASESWCVIARVMARADLEPRKVLDSYAKAISLGTGRLSPKTVYFYYKSLMKYISGHEDSIGSAKSSFWRRKASKYLEEHSAAIQQPVEDTDNGVEGAEDSQGLLEECRGDTPDELGQSSGEEGEVEGEYEEEDQGGEVGGAAVAERPKRVVQRRVNLERRNCRGETKLHVAVINNDVGAVKRLIKKGALVNTRDNCGWTPLHEACNYGFLETARILIESGARVDDPGGAGCEGVTPLIDAATNGHVSVVKLLVRNGADVMITNSKKKNALQIVEDSLLDMLRDGEDDSERNGNYRDIRSFLAAEMKMRGYITTSSRKTEEAGGNARKLKRKRSFDEPMEDALSRSSSSDGARGRSRGGKVGGMVRGVVGADGPLLGLGSRNRWNDRILYDDDDDDGGCSRKVSKNKRRKVESNSFLDLKSDAAGNVGINDRHIGARGASAENSGGLPRVMYNCLGQLEAPGPSLIPEKLVEEEEIEEESGGGKGRGDSSGKRQGYRVIDNWLVDDLEGEKRRKSKRAERDPSVERESRALLGVANSGKTTGKQLGREKAKSVTFKDNMSQLASQTSSPARGMGGGGAQRNEELLVSASEVGTSPELIGLRKSARKVVIDESSSESPEAEGNISSDDEAEFQRWKEAQSTQSTNTCSTPLISSSYTSNMPSPFSGTAATITTPHHAHLLPAPPPPMRIRVRILASSYRIPCPHYQKGGVATTVGWLADQAAERYFSQHGRRPVLGLTTVDGDSLCPADQVGHVLSPDEEVVALVQQWFTPPLLERYLVACRTSGVESLPRVLDLLEKDSDPQSLELANMNLLARDSAPLLQAIQSQLSLTSINLSGNKLRDDAMPRLQIALGELPSLQLLDLSSTGITHQGIHMLGTKPVGGHGDSMWRSLRVLHLSHNKLSTPGAGRGGVASTGSGLDIFLSMCSGLEELYLDGCGLTHEVIDALEETLKDSSRLRVLSLSKNPLGYAGLCSLWRAIAGLRVTSLLLSRVVTAKTTGSKTLSSVLQDEVAREYFKNGGGRYLEVFDISYCYHGDEEPLPVLMDCLGACPFLRELRLAGWGLAKGRINSLCRFVQQSVSLTSLDVSGNVSLGNVGVLELLNSFQSRMDTTGVDEVDEDVNLNLVACGMESPLPDELIRLVLQLKTGKGGPTVNLDLFGNLIEKDDIVKLKL